MTWSINQTSFPWFTNHILLNWKLWRSLFVKNGSLSFDENIPKKHFRIKLPNRAILVNIIHFFALRAVVAKNRAGKKWSSPIIKFHSKFESPPQFEYAGKFLDQSDAPSHFYRTRKVDDGFLGEKSSSWNYFPSFAK